MHPVKIYAGNIRQGGGLSVLLILIRRLQKIGYIDFQVYVSDEEVKNRLNLELGFKINVISIFKNHSSASRTILSKLYFFTKSIFWEKDTLFITINYWLPVVGNLLVYHVNLFSFYGVHSSIKNKIRSVDARIACRRASLNLFESKFLFDSAVQTLAAQPINSDIHYLGFNHEFIKNQSSIRESSSLVLVSSPQLHKNNDIIINALSVLVQKHPEIDWKLKVFGGQSKADWKDLSKYAEESGVSDSVIFFGPKPQREISDHLNSALALVSASTVESFCMVALEAMASKCPAIVVNSTSMPESVGKAGLLFEENNHLELSEKIVKLKKSKAFRDKIILSGDQHIVRFSEDRLIEDLENSLKLIKP